MATNVVNLNRFRKQKRREEEARQAAVNRVRHGRTKGEKEREIVERERVARLLEGKRMAAVDDPPATIVAASDEREGADPQRPPGGAPRS